MERAGIEIIPEFKVKFPEYSVITPITKKEYTIRSLKVSEEEILKGSLLTRNMITQHLNEVLYSTLVKKPDDCQTFESFLKTTTTLDRDALFFALYHATYKDTHAYDVTCKDCNHENSVRVNFANSFSISFWDKVDNDKQPINPLLYNIEVPLDISSNLTFVLGLVTLYEEQESMKTLSFANDQDRALYNDELIIKNILINIDGQKTQDRISDRKNIHNIYMNLPAIDKKIIDRKFKAELENYGTSIKTIVYCQQCKAKNEVTIDLVRQFFRALYE
jgi:hypothetical protein